MSSHINQEGLIVIGQPDDSKGHVMQEGVLVVASPSPDRHFVQEGILAIGFPFSSGQILQEGLLIIRENVPDAPPAKLSRAFAEG